jgi:serine phosphatase RsbU (regulator of sigma subunit)
LQESVLAPLPPIPGLDLAARHLPAARHIGMGGDWYQAIRLDDDRCAVIVGDVAGHGITAVGDMAQLRAAIGALVSLELPPAEVFRQTTALLRAVGHTVTATAVVAVIDTAADTILYAAAGHPQPLLRAPDGSVDLLRGGRHPLLGVPVKGIEEIGTAPFPAGSTLVLYTDGLVERRNEPIDECVERLARELGATTAVGSAAVADDLIVANLVGREPDDDIAIVVVTREA